ncbi:hypothetical protein WJX82_001603 [Trebouxia sp. C0006]
MAPSAVWLITGASRGIGAELAKQVLSTPNTVVFASARSVDSAKRLHELQKAFPSRLHLISMDVVGSSSIQAAVQAVTELTGESGVDYLVNNAGTAGPPVPAHEEKIDTFRTILEINVLGVHAVSQAFLPLLKMGHKKTVINMSSCLGSHAFLLSNPVGWENSSAALSAYKTSKAALNMPQGFTFVAVHPGLVTTDMGSAFIKSAKLDNPAIRSTSLTPEQSVEALRKTIANLKLEDTGKFLNYDGVPMLY